MPTVKELEQKLARLKKEEATIRTAMSSEKRRQDTKTKILYGAAALALVESDAELRGKIIGQLRRTVQRKADRDLLGLDDETGKG